MKTPSYYTRSIRYAGLVITIAAASVLQACSNDTIPTGPSSVTSSTGPSSVTRPPASPEPTQVRVFGTVTNDDGVPVAGVKVTVYRWTPFGQLRSTVTDSMGFYSISFVPADGISVLTEKQGYKSEWHNRTTSPAADFQFDLRIHRI